MKVDQAGQAVAAATLATVLIVVNEYEAATAQLDKDFQELLV
jgi:hypothetical protein